jgi:3-methyladenine DNA glycosylase AlkD
LYKLAKSDNLWEKRIAILGTFAFITKNNECKDTFGIAEILLGDKHDLIHKAVGWMLREVGKRVSRETEEEFLKKHYKTMPRTMLRYAIEHFPEEKRKAYLIGKAE